MSLRSVIAVCVRDVGFDASPPAVIHARGGSSGTQLITACRRTTDVGSLGRELKGWPSTGRGRFDYLAIANGVLFATDLDTNVERFDLRSESCLGKSYPATLNGPTGIAVRP
jgi:hypothetical protein